jgi:hypothetical protein
LDNTKIPQLDIASLDTFVMTKALTLVSRASEKDLYDLFWLFKNNPDLNIELLIERLQKFNSSINAEGLLMSVSSTTIEKTDTNKQIFDEVSEFKKQLIINLTKYLRSQPTPPLAALVKRIKKWV